MEGVEKKRDLLNKIAETERKIENYESEVRNLIHERRHEFRSAFCALEEVDARFDAQRKHDKQELRKQVDKIRLSVEAFKLLLDEMKPGPLCVEKLKITMEEIESLIITFKGKQREGYEVLLQEERVVTLEVNALEKKMENLSASHPVTIHPVSNPSHSRQNTQTTSLHPAIIAFDAFIEQTGGLRGGWDEYDHQAFLRVRTRHGGKSGFIQTAVSELPTRTVEDIEEHEQWYQEYTKLNDAKKSAISEWKQQKKDVFRTDEPVPNDSSPNVDEVQSRRAEIFAKEREARQAQLAAWKAQQQLRKEEEERMKQKQELERLQEVIKFKERQATVKEKVLQYAAKKLEEKEAFQRLEEAKEIEENARRKESTKETKKFRDRDTKVLSKKQLRQKMSEAKAMEKERRLQNMKAKITAERDPSRLLKLTAGWEERRKAGVGSGMAGALLVMPRRAVPSWRQGI